MPSPKPQQSKRRSTASRTKVAKNAPRQKRKQANHYLNHHALELAQIPERLELRALQQQLTEQRTTTAELDLAISEMRDELTSFERGYHAALNEEHTALRAIDGVVNHMLRWSDLLQQRPDRVGIRGEKVEAQRHRTLNSNHDSKYNAKDKDKDKDNTEKNSTDEEDSHLPKWLRTKKQLNDVDADKQKNPRSKKQFSSGLKELYRSLARRYHPDLARTEEERLNASRMMSYVNQLYKLEDFDRLSRLAEQSRGGEITDTQLPVTEQLILLTKRAKWFNLVNQNLNEEFKQLVNCPTNNLRQEITTANEAGEDLLAQVKEQLQQRATEAYSNVREIAYVLEDEVAKFNRKQTKKINPHVGGKLSKQNKQSARQELQRVFDPSASQELVRLGLQQLNSINRSPANQRLAQKVVDRCEETPHIVRLMLLTYVCELTPSAQKSLASFDDIDTRFDYLEQEEESPVTLAKALVEADDMVEYGVKKADSTVAHLGLRFRHAKMREAIPLALESIRVRRHFRDILNVLGEVTECPTCNENVFPIPLLRLRGLDDKRAEVCPYCGTTMNSYWMPRGQDVQSVLNTVFLDYDIVSKFTLSLSRATVSMQLLPIEVENMTVGELKRRFVDEIFARNEIDIGRGAVQLWSNRKRLAEKMPLSDLLDDVELTAMKDPILHVRFTDKVKQSEDEVMEIVRHRIRNRFR